MEEADAQAKTDGADSMRHPLALIQFQNGTGLHPQDRGIHPIPRPPTPDRAGEPEISAFQTYLAAGRAIPG